MTKQERNILYKRMLKIYKDSLKNGLFCGICFVMYEMSAIDDKWYRIQNFKELMKYRPTKFYNYDGHKTKHDDKFWFPVKDIESRIELLEKAIKETNPN